MKNSRAGYRTTLAIWILALLFAVSAEAGTLTVTTTSDSGGSCPGSDCTLRQALATAVSGDTIVFQIPTTDPAYDANTGYYTITLTGATAANKTLVIDKNLIIDGGSGRPIVVRRANAAPTDFRVFNVKGGVTATLSRIWISNGNVTTATATAGEPTFFSYGGGIRNFGTLTLRDCILTGNAAVGAGALVAQSDTTLIRTTFSGNSAGSFGGAIYSGGVIFVTIDTCTFSSNTASEGGAIYSDHGVFTFKSSTISGNTATGGAGTRGGGGIVSTGTSTPGNNGTAYFENTIVAGNTAPLAPDVWGTMESRGHNLIGNPDSNSGFTGTGDQIGVTPAQLNLKPIDYYGGFIPTMPPNSGSFAIDKGKQTTDVNGQPSATDQRGQPRPVDRNESNGPGGDGNDIGAVEVGVPQTGPTFTVTTTAERNDGSCTADDCTLVEALNVANAVADPNTINFAPGVVGVIKTATLTPSGLAITNPVTINGPGAQMLVIKPDLMGRAFRVTSSNVRISGLTVFNGRVNNDNGGAIHNTGGLTLTDCLIEDNAALSSTGVDTQGLGGGIYNGTGASLEVIRCTLHNNTAARFGAGVFNDGILTATNCTFSANTAVQGGGIYSSFNNNTTKVSLRNCTITICESSGTGTASGDGGGGLHMVGNNGQYNLGNCIVAGNLSSANPSTNPDIRGNFTSDGHNLIGNVGFSTGFSNNVNGDQVGTPGAPKPPSLGPLTSYGGPTITHALLSGSTAINAGDDSLAPPTDQRGYFRSGTSDIGAFEFNGIAPAPPTVVTGSATNITSTSATLNASVNPNGLGTTFQFVSDFASFAVQDAGSGTNPVAFSISVTGLTPNTQYHLNATATSNSGTSQGVQQSFTTLAAPTPTPTPTPGLVGNVSTRLPVGTGDNALFEGFIVQGPVGSTKKIMVRAIGPSLLPFGVADALGDPVLEIRDAGSAVVATNDNWGTTQVGGIITGDQSAEIGASGLAPGNNLESAIIANLAPGSYTAVVRGVGDTIGTGVVDAYDLSAASSAKLANVATRGLIQPGDKLMIAGFIIQNGSVTAVVRAIGPSLSAFGVTNALPDTTLQLRDQNGVIVRENDDWQSDQKAELEATSLQPSDPLEAAVVVTIPPGQYTAQVRGKPEATGTGVVQVYFLQ